MHISVSKLHFSDEETAKLLGNVPALHAVHVALLVAPVAAEYVPTSHVVQVALLVAPVTAE